MVLVFDLDDTLYPESAYVESGFRAVADWLAGEFGWDADGVLATMQAVLAREGRGRVFDRLLELRGRCRKTLVKQCVRVYRQHLPAIVLFPAARALLPTLDQSLYLVTDGHKGVQARKVRALGLEEGFRKVLITHRYGVKNAKPSIHCFERIRQREQCAWTDLAYIGDNPQKDFVNLNPLGVLTIRVRTGPYRHLPAAPGYDARYSIDALDALPTVLARLHE